MHNTTDMYSQLVDHLTVIHRVTISTMPHCHKDRRRVHSVRVRVYHLSPKAHRVPRVIPTARRLACMCASCMFVVPASRSQPFIVYVVCCTRLTHVRCTRFTLSTVHCVRRLLYTPPNAPSPGIVLWRPHPSMGNATVRAGTRVSSPLRG